MKDSAKNYHIIDNMCACYHCDDRIQCANGRDSCEPTYTYRHHLPLTSDSNQFRVSCIMNP